LCRCLAPTAAAGGKGREEEEEQEEEEAEEEGGRGAPLAPGTVTIAPGIGSTREEAETGERGNRRAIFFTKEKRKLRYIFGGLDSNTKPRKLIRSRTSAQEATPDGIGLKQSRPLDGEIKRRRTFEVEFKRT
jgi:hypothetical protein